MVARIKLKQDFGLEIRKARTKAKLTQVELAVAAGISTSHLQGFEGGQHYPNIETLFRLARALEMHPSDLIVPCWDHWIKMPLEK